MSTSHDDELTMLREQRRAALQQQLEAQASQQADAEVKAQQAHMEAAQLDAAMRTLLTNEARSRLATVAMAKPARASTVKQTIVQLHHEGKFTAPMSDEQLKQLLSFFDSIARLRFGRYDQSNGRTKMSRCPSMGEAKKRQNLPRHLPGVFLLARPNRHSADRPWFEEFESRVDQFFSARIRYAIHRFCMPCRRRTVGLLTNAYSWYQQCYLCFCSSLQPFWGNTFLRET